MADIRLTNVAIRDGLATLKWQFENSETDYILVFKTGEYGKGQYRTEVNAINLLADALELLKEQQPKTGHWVAKTKVSWHENGDDDATPVFYATLTCSECGKPYSYEVANTFVDYDEWESAYIPNGPVLNDERTQIYNKTLEKHIENLKSFRCEWVSCPYCGAKMEKQP